MKQYEIPLEEGQLYHIYNRGINGTNLFFEEGNYAYFLLKYSQYLGSLVDTYAYCLLKNHFHLLVRIKETSSESNLQNKADSLQLNEKGLHSTHRVVSKKFSDFFNSYTKSINKGYHRTGGLFETPFRRIVLSDEEYFSRLVWYIHWNPQKHGFVQDFKEYSHSSYHSHLAQKPTKLDRDYLVNWFGSTQEYIAFHESMTSESTINHLILE